MKLQLVAKRIDATFEAALVVNGHFQRATSGKNLSDLFNRLIEPVTSAATQEDGSVIIVDVITRTAEEEANDNGPEAAKG